MGLYAALAKAVVLDDQEIILKKFKLTGYYLKNTT